MEYTQNYQLPLWDKEDAVLRTDFNENNQKIDVALGEIGYVKLLDVTTQEDAAQIDLDVSQIDFAQYWKLEFYLDCPLTSGNVFVRTNNVAEGYSHVSQGSSTTASYEYMLYITAPGSRAQAFSFLSPNAASPVVIVVHQAFWDKTSFETRGPCGISPITWGELATLNFYVSSGTIPAGTRFVLRGVKK